MAKQSKPDEVTEPQWVESPESTHITLAEGITQEIIVVKDCAKFISVDTQYGVKQRLMIEFPYPGEFRTGSAWLVSELNKHLQAGKRHFSLRREGYKIRYCVED